MPDRDGHRPLGRGLRVAGFLVLVAAWAALGSDKPPLPKPLREADAKVLQAAQQGSATLAQAALAEGANLNCEGTNGLTPLLQALCGASAPVDTGRRECVAFLLAHGAHVDAQDNDKRTALIYATRAGDLETVQLLVNAGAFIKHRDRFHKTATLYAAETGRREILIYLGQTLKVQQKQSAW